MTAAYDSYNYPGYWKTRSYEHQEELVALKSFFKIIGKVNSIIDIGCGHGRMCDFYSQYGKKVILADPSKKLLAIAMKNCTKSSSARGSRKKFVHSTVQKLPGKLGGEKVDVASMIRVIHHIDDPEAAFLNINKLLKKKGYFILEFANKVHGKAIIKQFLKGDFTFPLDIFPNDRRSTRNINEKSILFLNHHPDKIEECLINNGFKIIERRSVSNVRSEWMKRYIPTKLLLLTTLLQKPLAKINFGPSIFILAKKI